MALNADNAKEIRLSFRPLWLSVPCLIGVTFFWGGLLVDVQLNGQFWHLDFLALGTTVLTYAFAILITYQILRYYKRRMILQLVRIQVWTTLIALASLLLFFIMMGHSGYPLFSLQSLPDWPTWIMAIIAISSLGLSQLLLLTNFIIGLSGRRQ